MSPRTRLALLWLLLIGLTLAGALLGDRAEPGLAVTLVVALSMALKGRVVVDHFMGMRHANRTLRRLMRGYFYVLPLLVVLTTLYGDWIARWLTIH